MSWFIATFIGTWALPFKQYQKLKEEGLEASIKPYVIYVLLVGVIAGLITAIGGQFGPPMTIAGEVMPKWMVWLSIVIVPLVSLIGSFVGSFIVWAIITGIVFGTLSQYKSIYRVLAILSAFSPVSALLGFIPVAGQYLGFALNLWAIVLMIVGVIIVLQTPPIRTAIVLGLVFAVIFAFVIAARVLANRQLTAGGPDFGEFDTLGNEEDNLTDEQLDKELEALANQAKEDAKKK